MGKSSLQAALMLTMLTLGSAVAAGARADVIDRYGGGSHRAVTTATTAPQRYLTWPGKTDADAPPSAPVVASVVAPVAAYVPSAPMIRPVAMAPQAPPQTPVAPLAPTVRVASNPPVPATPASPPAEPATNTPARFYSLHRDYGLQPDPAPVAPPNFTSGADLAAADEGAATPLPSPKTSQGRLARTTAILDAGEPTP